MYAIASIVFGVVVAGVIYGALETVQYVTVKVRSWWR